LLLFLEYVLLLHLVAINLLLVVVLLLLFIIMQNNVFCYNISTHIIYFDPVHLLFPPFVFLCVALQEIVLHLYLYVNKYKCLFIYIYGCEGKQVVFVFLSLTYFPSHGDLQFYPFFCKWHNFILLYGWIIFHFLYAGIDWWALRLIP
jgi:hypothetical protein